MVESDFDYESITLGLYQEGIELDLFNDGIATFSMEDWLSAGLTAEDVSMIQFMAQQEQGHATLLTNMLGVTAPPQCTYNFPYTTPREFVDFNQLLTRWDLLQWDTPGQPVGPNNNYVTVISPVAGPPAFVAWTNQLNLTYTPLVFTGENTGYTYQPNGTVYENGSPIVTRTTFIALTDTDLFLTPFNLSMINPHVVALGMFQAG
ncbi:hypothetical protein LTR74_017145 [Friedmanniomyces endolithicus]|nr:hypothetical protein LTR74_017145 [Friedmanniomyces endolithicus]